jgi:hypothetical protein
VLSAIATLLSFAVTLFVSIVALAVLSAVRHAHMDMAIAYRVIGVRAVMIAAPLAFVIIGAIELRTYFRARAEARPLKLEMQ